MTQIVYQTRLSTLFLGDVLETLAEMDAESVDLIFADPPYNLSNDGTTCHSGRQVSVNKAAWDRSQGFEADYQFHFNWINACYRVLKPNGTLWISGTYHSIYACGHVLQQQGWHLINDITWFKPNAAPNLACRQFAASHETLLWAKKNKKAKHAFNYSTLKDGVYPSDILKKANKQMRSVWSISTPSSKEKKYGKHPTQKPLALLTRIVMAASNEGDIILDPFCGSGTTGVAAISNSRSFIGIDNQADYLLKIAKHRLREAEIFAEGITN
jgi:site-specific DNA-methyltransferase (adenine-specific)